MNPEEEYLNNDIEDISTTPVADVDENKKSVVEKEISLEKRKLAENTILATLELTGDENLENFDEKLKKATKSLPRYQQIEKKLENIDQQNLSYELFKALKQEADEPISETNMPNDGVLIKSMRQGPIECAGRALIASTFLREHNIDHAVVSAPGHSFLILEKSSDTLVYFDTNNNLYFTFPNNALEGYENINTSSECKLNEFIPRETDFADGVNTAFSQFVSMPASEGTGRQYLGNVAAALNGNEEFNDSDIQVDKEVSEIVHEIEKEIYGENAVLENFYSKVEKLIEKKEMETADDKKVIGDILKSHSSKNDFVAFFSNIITGNLGDRVPYIKNASEETRKGFAEKIWESIKDRNINKTIRGR